MNATTLKDSRWAPASFRHNASRQLPLTNVNNQTNSQPQHARKTSLEKRQHASLTAYQKFLKLLRRLKWKSGTLLYCHHRALTQQTNIQINGMTFQISSMNGRANAAEIMFKTDFFEWYANLERCLTNLLECFGMVISADFTTDSVPLFGQTDRFQNTENSIIGDSVAFHGYAHRFHANVLAALDRPTNPLHQILGLGIVRQYLGIAKEFRNRWKEVEDEAIEPEKQLLGIHRSYHQILADLQLDALLGVILSALDQAQVFTATHLVSAHGTREVEMINADDDDVNNNDAMADDAMDFD